LRFGILGAAGIAPLALIYPVKNHPDAVVKAVAARDQGRADAFAKKHGIPKAYGGSGSYQSAWVYVFFSSVPRNDYESNRRIVG
jgi:predicted dehydrogenase